MTPLFSMRHALEDPNLLGGALRGDSWATWRLFLIASQGEPLVPAETEVFSRFTGGRAPPNAHSLEQVFVVGRRGGKDASTAVKAVYLATCAEYPELKRGEHGTLLVIAPDTTQASIQLNYIRGVLEASPLLRQRIVSQTADTISLDNRIDIVVRASSFRRLRGLTCVAVIASESAFWLNENSSNPDTEILRAVRPSLLTTGGPLIQISTPYARRGELWNSYTRHFGKDSPVLVVSGASIDFNPTLSKDEIARAYEEDFQGANAEYGAQFRNDISAFIERQTVLDCINVGVKEIGPRNCRYYGFVDPSGGSSDSMVLCIAHQEDGVVVVDALLERIPPFSPSDVVHEFAATLKRYGLSRVEGDKYAAQWTVEAFSKAGIAYRYCELTTSDLFRELVPALNTRSVHLLDNSRAIGQLCALERRVGRAGRDSISHAPGGHDDVACAIAGAVYLAGTHAAQRGEVRTGVIGPGGAITWLDSRKTRVSALDASHNGCRPGRGYT